MNGSVWDEKTRKGEVMGDAVVTAEKVGQVA
jgi:hypothetical protein